MDLLHKNEDGRSRILICGVSGQDGALLAASLLKDGYEVHGTSRDAQSCDLWRLRKLGIANSVTMHSMATNDFRSVITVLTKVEPTAIYNLAGQTSVQLSFGQPAEALESVVNATLNLLEAIRLLGAPIRLFNAGSSECFGDTDIPATEETAFHPKSPYAVAKSSAFWLVNSYRQAYDMFATSGILFNHESHLRSSHFVTQKIICAACDIARGSTQRLTLGNIDIVRDWGWAGEYVEAMRKVAEADTPDDYIICTGESSKLQDFLDLAFQHYELDWQAHTDIRKDLFRPLDLSASRGDPTKIRESLGWHAQIGLKETVERMIAHHEAILNARQENSHSPASEYV